MSTDNALHPALAEILVVTADLKYISEILTEAGYSVRPASDGELALRSVQVKRPDLILLDINLPGIKGAEVCRRIKSDPGTKDIPVIFISALGETELKVTALEAGGTDYVTKPVDSSEVLARINTHLNLYRLQQELVAQSEDLLAEIERRKHAEELIRESEEKYKALYDNAPLSYQSLDEQGCFLDVNPTWLRTLGYERDEIIGKSYADFLHPDYKPYFEKNFPEFKRRGYVSNVQFKIRHKKGHFLDISFEGCIGYQSDGSFHQTYCVFQNITARLQAENELLVTSELTRNIVDSSPVGIAIYDAEGNCITANAAAAEDIGATMTQMMQQNYHQVDSWKKSGLYNVALRTMQEQRKNRYEIKVETTFGKVCHLDIHLAPISIGDMPHLLLMYEDISELKQEMMKTARFSRVLEHSLNEIYLFDAKTFLFTEVNRGALENLGYSIDELHELTPLDIKPEFTAESFAELVAPLQKGAEEKIQFSTFHKRKDGTLYPVEIHLQLIKDSSPVFFAIVLDITRRMRAEEERERLTHAIEQSAEAVVITDPKGIIQYVNPAFEIITGYTSVDAIGQNPRILKSDVQDDAFYKEMWGSLIQGETWNGTFVNRKKDGSLYTEEATISPVRNASGATVNFVAVKRDVTERKRGEKIRARLNAQLEAKNKELAKLVYVTSHDLRSPLISVEGFSGILGASLKKILSVLDDEGLSSDIMERLEPSINDSREAIEFISKGATKMDLLLKGLLQMSRLGRAEIKKEELNMNELISAVLSSVKFQSDARGAKIEVSDLPPCIGDERQINPLFSNLIGNAFKYTDTDRPCSIKISGYKEGDLSVYCVEDNGIGIAPEYHKRIFEIFHQLNPAAAGEGLGLNIAQMITEKHDGRVWVESEHGKGSRFYVALPGELNTIE